MSTENKTKQKNETKQNKSKQNKTKQKQKQQYGTKQLVELVLFGIKLLIFSTFCM